MPKPGIEVTVSDAWGNITTVIGGSKQEHGPGGFEVAAPHPVKHTIAFLGETFAFKMRNKSAFVTFCQTAGAPLEPGSESTSGSEPGSEGEEPSLAMTWAAVTSKLDRIEELVQRLPSGR
jgi:hypothetical protein